MKEELLKILEMNKSGTITEEQAAQLISELSENGEDKGKSRERGGLASMIHDTIHLAMDSAKSHHRHHHHHGQDSDLKGNTCHMAHLEPPRGSEMEFQNNEIHMSSVGDIQLKRSKMNQNRVDASKLHDLNMVDAHFSENQISASSVTDVKVRNSVIHLCKMLASKLQDFSVESQSLLENLEINASCVQDARVQESEFVDVVIRYFHVKDVHVLRSKFKDVLFTVKDGSWSFRKRGLFDLKIESCSFEKVLFSDCRFSDVVIKNVELRDINIQGLTLSDQVIDGTEAFLRLIKKAGDSRI